MILKYYLFRKDITYQRDYALKTFFNSEGTLHRIGTTVLRTLLILNGQQKKMRRRIADGEERKSSRQLSRTLWRVECTM